MAELLRDSKKVSLEPLTKVCLTIINSHQGISQLDLLTKVMSYINPTTFTQEDYALVLMYLTLNKDVTVMIYTLPNESENYKGIYFPKGTKLVKKLND